MWRKWKEIKERTEAWLDERWEIANRFQDNASKTSFYYVAVKALELVGIEWRRNQKGNIQYIEMVGGKRCLYEKRCIQEDNQAAERFSH